MMELYDRIVDKDLTIRRVNVVAVQLIPEDQIPEEAPVQLDLFTDYAALEKQKEAEREHDAKERKIQEATLSLQARYGKNAILKGMNLLDGATTILRNGQIGGHRAGEGCNTTAANTAGNPREAADATDITDIKDTHTDTDAGEEDWP